MKELSYRRHRFPPVVIQHAVWLYLRFHAQLPRRRGAACRAWLDISYETIRRWVLEVRTAHRARLRRPRPGPSNRWHLDESAPRTHDQQRECGAA
jgi:putative transposase